MKKQVSVLAVLALVGAVGFGTVAHAEGVSAPRIIPTAAVVPATPVEKPMDTNPAEPAMVSEPAMDTSMPAPMVGMPSPMHPFNTIGEAAQYIGFEPQLPKVLPVGFNVESINTINKDLIQIIYSYQPGEDMSQNQAAGTRINYRVSTQTGDISGDYNKYNVVKTETVDGVKVTFKGGEKMVRLATWEKDGQNHAIAFERPVTRDMAKAIIENVKVTKHHSDKK